MIIRPGKNIVANNAMSLLINMFNLEKAEFAKIFFRFVCSKHVFCYGIIRSSHYGNKSVNNWTEMKELKLQHMFHIYALIKITRFQSPYAAKRKTQVKKA